MIRGQCIVKVEIVDYLNVIDIYYYDTKSRNIIIIKTLLFNYINIYIYKYILCLHYISLSIAVFPFPILKKKKKNGPCVAPLKKNPGYATDSAWNCYGPSVF